MKSLMRPFELAPPAAGNIHDLFDDLVWFRFSLPFRLDHINLYALLTDHGWLLIDCGINAESNALQWPPVLETLRARAPISGIIISHHHADHIGYAGQLAQITGAPVMIGQTEHDQAMQIFALSDAESGEIAGNAYLNFGFDDETVARKRAGGNFFRTLVGELPEVQIIEPGHVFTTVSGKWEVRFDAGHSPGHMSLTDAARGLFIGIDFLLPRISPNVSVSLQNPDADVLADYLAYLHEMVSLDNDWLVLPGHDWPYFGGGTRASELINHHNARLQTLLDANQTLTTKQAIDILFPFRLNDHEMHFASGEARAHLNHLVTIGKLVRETKDNVALFRHP